MRARIRTIKPEVFHDEALWALYLATGFPILQGFAGLWCYADRDGRFEWRPAALKALVVPYWDGDFEALLLALASYGFIRQYEVDGRLYGLVVNFKKHQAINHREPPSTLPEPPDDYARACPGAPVWKGREGKGTEGEGNDAHGAERPLPVATFPLSVLDDLRDADVSAHAGSGVSPMHTSASADGLKPLRAADEHERAHADIVRRQYGGEGQAIPATYHTLDGWELSAELRAAALMAGVPDIDERVAAARALRIAAPHGTTDRDKWVRAQFPRWRRWREQDAAKQSYGRAPAEAPKPKPPRVKGCPPWVTEKHEATATGAALDVRTEALACAKANPGIRTRNDAGELFTLHLEQRIRGGSESDARRRLLDARQKGAA